MNHSEEEFIHMVQDDYTGHVKIEILFDVRNEKRLGFLEGRFAMSIKPEFRSWTLILPPD